MFAFLKSLFGMRDTHEGITAGLAKMVRRLENLAEGHFSDAVAKEAKADLLTREAKDHRNEHARALATADKIGALIS